MNYKRLFHQIKRIVAKNYLRFFSDLTIVGVTGSYGKTNTTRAITQVLAEKYPVLQTDINLDTVYNLPITLLKLRPKHKVLVLEYGVDHQGEMDFHLDLVKSKIGVVTGIAPVHSDEEHLGSLKNVIKEKGKLLAALPLDGWAILNGDEEEVRKMAKLTKAKVIWYGYDQKNCDWWVGETKIGLSGTEFEIGTKNKILNDALHIKTKLIGSHFGHSILVAAIVGDLMGLSLEQIKRGIEKLEPLKGRMSLEPGPKRTMILNDALRANPASTIAGLETLAQLPAKRKIAILGEMGELGSFADKSHQQIGKKVANLELDYLLGVGPLNKQMVKSAVREGMKKEKVFWAANVQSTADILQTLIKPGDLLYLKGSLLRHMERVVLLIDDKKVTCQKVSCHQYNQCPACPVMCQDIVSTTKEVSLL